MFPVPSFSAGPRLWQCVQPTLCAAGSTILAPAEWRELYLSLPLSLALSLSTSFFVSYLADRAWASILGLRSYLSPSLRMWSTVRPAASASASQTIAFKTRVQSAVLHQKLEWFIVFYFRPHGFISFVIAKIHGVFFFSFICSFHRDTTNMLLLHYISSVQEKTSHHLKCVRLVQEMSARLQSCTQEGGVSLITILCISS